MCALPHNNEGMYYCKNPWPVYEPAEFLGDYDEYSPQSRTYCGSEFDRWGNERFTYRKAPYGYSRMLAATYNENFNWGFTSFDTFGASMTTIFQCVSMEGWTAVLYMGIDVAGYGFSSFLFIGLILIGAFFVLNIVLAILSASVEKANTEADEALQDNKNLSSHSLLKVAQIVISTEQEVIVLSLITTTMTIVTMKRDQCVQFTYLLIFI